MAVVAAVAVLAGHHTKVQMVGVAAVAAAQDLMPVKAAAVNIPAVQELAAPAALAAPAHTMRAQCMLVVLVVVKVRLAIPVKQLVVITHVPVVPAVQQAFMLLAAGMLHGHQLASGMAQQVKL